MFLKNERKPIFYCCESNGKEHFIVDGTEVSEDTYHYKSGHSMVYSAIFRQIERIG